MKSSSSMELVFIPTAAMGHLLAAVEVAKHILHRDQRISIFFLILKGPATTSTLVDFLESMANDNNPYPSRLIFHTIPPLSNPPDPSSPNFFQTLIDLHKPLVKQAVEDRLQVRSSRLAGFVLDMFFSSMVDVADEFKVPSFFFFTSGANFLSLLFHVQSLADDQGVDIATAFSDPNTEYDLPGFVNRVNGKYIPSVVADKEAGLSLLLDITRSFRKSKGILVNTFKELESCGVQALFDLAAKKTIPAVYAVGPILELDSSSRGQTQTESRRSIKEWLDDQPLSSVVFICFGSLGTLNEDQVKEIAKGLEQSGHRFLWSLRKPPPEGMLVAPGDQDDTFVDALPEGFLDRTADRGRVIGWAPQVLILAHPSVGGFVSHCGWNSTLESLWFGVPMATWPLKAEQPLNAYQLVKELGLAVEIRNDYKYDQKTRKANIIVTAEEVEDGVKKLMNLNEGIKSRVREISHKSRKTLDEGGSSYECLGRFVQDLWNNLE